MTSASRGGLDLFNNPILFSDPMGNHPPKGGDDPLEPKGYPTTGGRMVYVPSQNPVFRSDFLSILPTGGGVPSGTVATDDVLPANTPTQISQWIISYDAESGTFGGYWKTYRIEFSVIDGTLGEAGYYAADGSRYDDSPYRPAWYKKLPTINGRWEIQPFDPNVPFDQSGRFLMNSINSVWNGFALSWNSIVDGTAPSGQDILNSISETSWEDIGNAAKDIRTYENLTGNLLLFLLFRSVMPAAATGTSGTVTGTQLLRNIASEWTTVGRWMSKAEYEIMKKSGRMVEGAGGQTFVTVGGSKIYPSAAKGSVYVEFEVPKSSLLQGGQTNWFKAIGPNAGRAMQAALQKQGGQLLPEIRNLSTILEVK